MEYSESALARSPRRRHHPAPPPLDPESSRVLAAAVRLFWRHGYRQTTTRDIEAVAGISLSRIYCLFGSKERLLASALLRYAELLKRELLAPLEESGEGLAAVDAFFDRLGHWVTHEGRPGCMLVNMMAEPGRQQHGVHSQIRSLNERLCKAFEQALDGAAARGETDGSLSSARAQVLTTAVLGVNLAARGGADDAELQRMLAGIHAQIGAWRRH